MPELPEVETIARALRPDLIGRTILGADVRWARTLAMPSVRKFKKQIQGLVIRSVERRAKFLNMELTAPRGPRDQAYHLLIHLRMSGDLTIKPGKIIPEKHDRLILTLSGARSLVFNDTRKFGRVWLTQDLGKVVGKLGPEPLSSDFTPKWLHAALQARHRQLKPLLLDQTFLAGLGNIYTDEALHIAKLHPLTVSDSVTTHQAKKLHGAISSVLQEGILRNGASIDWVYRGGDFQNHFRVYDRDGQPCPVCGATIQRIVVGQRGTHICPDCQMERATR
jgi:formamidopyrimidine-DNA glycosylase